MQGRSGDTVVENGLVDRVGEGESGTNGESSNNVHTIMSKINSWWEVSYISGGGRGGEGRAQYGGGICIIMADLNCCMTETNITL